ncbi:hypothetical protein PtB15_8B649 [Puccinia triticina]|nr:hypothetical protein PtB15_8B649 [Puccinia triticina]
MIDLQEAAATPLDTSNVEQSASDEAEVTPDNPQEFPPIPPPPEATYRSKDECFQSIQKWALKHGFAITTASSYKVKNGICVKYQCDKSGAYRPHRKPVEPPDESGELTITPPEDSEEPTLLNKSKESEDLSDTPEDTAKKVRMNNANQSRKADCPFRLLLSSKQKGKSPAVPRKKRKVETDDEESATESDSDQEFELPNDPIEMVTRSGRVINRKPPNNLDRDEYNPKSPCNSENDESKGNKVNEGVQSERSKGNEVDEGVQSESQPEDESDESDDENRNDWVVFNQYSENSDQTSLEGTL